jgi:hypothetical protein
MRVALVRNQVALNEEVDPSERGLTIELAGATRTAAETVDFWQMPDLAGA